MAAKTLARQNNYRILKKKIITAIFRGTQRFLVDTVNDTVSELEIFHKNWFVCRKL